MSNSIHGHQIMQLIHELDSPVTREALRRVVSNRFGADARFHTCSAERMTVDQLLEFLAMRGKVVEVDGCLRTDVGQMCDHED